MPRSKTFNVKDGRAFFICPSCRFKKMVTVITSLRKRKILCQRCGEKISCTFDRRELQRSNQCGRVLLLTGGAKTEVNLFDLSMNGAGFELDIRSKIKVAVGDKIELHCQWNPMLFTRKHFVVRSVRGCKIGVERLP